MKVQQVMKGEGKGRKLVWQADVAASKLRARRRFSGATWKEAIAKANAVLHEHGAAGAFGPLTPAVYAVASKWSADGMLDADEINTACREYYERRGFSTTATALS